MAEVKVPALLHKMSLASQKAWYKKHGMEMPSTSAAGKSAAQAKKDVGEINKKKARETAIAAAAAASKKNKELVSSSDRVRMMRKNADMFGGGLGGGLERNRDIVNFVRSGGYIKAGRLGEEAVDEAVVKTKDINKEKLKNYVRGLGTKAVIAGKVPFDQVHSPLRAGRKALKQESATEVNEMSHGKKLAKMIMAKQSKHPIAQQMGEETGVVSEQDDTMEKKEMAQTQLHFIKYAAEEILEFIKMGGEIEEWYQNKLSKVQSEVESLHSYIEGEKRRTGMVESAFDIDTTGYTKNDMSAINHERNQIKKIHGKLLKTPGFVRKVSDEKSQLRLAGKVFNHMKRGQTFDSALVLAHKQGVAEGSEDSFKASHNDAVEQAKSEHGDPAKHEYKFDNMSGRHGAHNSYLHYPDKKVTVNTQMYKSGPAHNVFVSRGKQGVAEGYKDGRGGYKKFSGSGSAKQPLLGKEGSKRKAHIRDIVQSLHSMDASKPISGDHHAKILKKLERLKEEAEQVDEKMDLAKAKMGDVVKDFYKSKAPQFKGKSMAKRREMAVAAKLGAEREEGMREEVVTEAEGKVAVTPKEKSLAAHHGDKTRITYGDVIKARLKSAAAKKMGK
jgi:hypothetical protein